MGINLDDYSKSEGFIGYCCKSISYRHKIVKDISQYFLKFISNGEFKGSIYSSLFVKSNEIGHWGDKTEDARDLRNAEELRKHDLLSSFDLTDFGGDPESGEYLATIAALEEDVKKYDLKDIPDDVVRIICEMMMTAYGVYGHVFVVFDELKLAFYPHDDQGFGVIAIGDDAKIETGIEFLKGSGKVKGIEYHIGRNGLNSVGGGAWKVGPGPGKAPRRNNKIVVSSDGQILKKDR